MPTPSPTSTADLATDRRCAVLAISRGGCERGARLADRLHGDFFACKGRLAAVMQEVWHRYPAIVCIMATGIVIRTIAPLLRDKYHDPAVVVCDELGQFAISLLSGHIGGANDLAERVAGITGGQAVITTASDVLGYTPLDLWCRQWQLTPVSTDALTRTMGRLVDQGHVTLWSRYPLPRLPEDLRQTSDRSRADLSIDSRLEPTGNGTLLFPRSLVFGIGCNRGTPAEVIAAAVTTTCQQHNLAPQAIARLASIDLKQDEVGLCEYARRHDLPLDFYTKDQLNQVEGVSVSPAVQRATGAKGVAEPAALLSAGVDSTLLVPKIKWPAVTTAVAEIADPLIVSTHKEATAP